MLIVSRKGTNGGYKGRFDEKARALVKSGVRVGMMHLDSDPGKKAHCHVCAEDFEKPPKEAGFDDAWGECPACKTPFVFHWI